MKPPTITLVLALSILFAASSVQAQMLGGFTPFGKNKKQYEKFNWRYISSANFDVYFHGSKPDLARYTSREAEIALTTIQEQLGYTITKRITFIVYNSHNQFQQTNVISEMMTEGIGGVTELFKNRIVVPFEGDYSKFRHVVHHELVHAVLNDMFYGGSIQSLVNNPNAVRIPLWMNEGFAEFSSAGGMDVKTDMFMRDVAVSEYLRGFDQLQGYFAYRGGQAFWTYVANTYGKAKIGMVFNALRMTRDLDQAFMSAFKMNVEDMSERWVKEEKKYYFPDVGKYEYVEDFAKRLTNHQKDDNFYNTSPAISPNGDRVAFISDRGSGTFGVYLMNLKTKEVEELVTSGRSADFEELNFLTPGISWNPKGTKLAVAGKAPGQDAIYIVDVTSGDYDRITLNMQTIGGVAWSPDGRRIAFDADTGGKQRDIYIYDTFKKTTSKLTNDIFTDQTPVWSPDGAYVYFISDRMAYLSQADVPLGFDLAKHDVDSRDIYRVPLAGGSIERITEDPDVGKYSLAIAPKGNTMLYVADYNGISNLWKMDLATKSRVPLTNSLQEVSQISLSLDGTKLMFASQNRVGYDLFQLDFPLELKAKDTLPVTLFQKQRMQERNALTEIISKRAEPTAAETFSYGNFDVDLADQKSVKPNEDLVVSPDGNLSEDGDQGYDTVSAVSDYKVAFSPDIVTGNAGFDNFLGATGQIDMLFSDMMGDHEIYLRANLFYDLNNSSIFLSYSYLPNLIDLRIAAFQNAGFLERASQFGLNWYRVRSYGLDFQASYPFTRYTRVDAGLQVLGLSQNNLDVPQEQLPSLFVTVPSVSFVLDDGIWGMWAPMKGTRLNLTVEGSPKWSGKGLEFATARLDARHYIHLGGMYSFALRGTAGISAGTEAQKFYIGGTDNLISQSNGRIRAWPFVNVEDFMFTRPGWPLRGWSINERNGSQFFVTNVEFRFPFLFAFKAGPIPSLFQGMQAQFFFDAGNAYWESFNQALQRGGDYNTGDMLKSVGVGVRNVALGLPLRIDVAWRFEQTGGMSAPVWMFSLGGDF
jgi:Tol biopolymer transport system component